MGEHARPEVRQSRALQKQGGQSPHCLRQASPSSFYLPLARPSTDTRKFGAEEGSNPPEAHNPASQPPSNGRGNRHLHTPERSPKPKSLAYPKAGHVRKLPGNRLAPMAPNSQTSSSHTGQLQVTGLQPTATENPLKPRPPEGSRGLEQGLPAGGNLSQVNSLRRHLAGSPPPSQSLCNCGGGVRGPSPDRIAAPAG